MDFMFDEKTEALRREVRRFAREELPTDHIIQTEEYASDNLWSMSMAISKKLAQKGWLTISWPREFGGMGASDWEQAAFKEEAGYWAIPGTNMGVGGTGWIGPTLMLMGTEEQRKKFLPPIAAGDEDGVWSTGYSEPDAGSDLASLRTMAHRQGDEYVINGQKIWNSGGNRARWCWLACRTNPDTQKKHQGISIIIVDMQSEGVSIRPIANIVGHHSFNEIFFKDVRVPATNLVGQENKGWSVLMTALSFERELGLYFSGMFRRALDELILYTREAGLITRQAIRNKLAELAMHIGALRLNVYETVWKQSMGEKVIYEPSMDKLYMVEVLERIGCTGSEILGAYAQLDPLYEYGPHTRVQKIIKNMYWMASGMVSGGGTQETMRNIVAQFGLQLPKTN
ncbi:MAG: acyl-CoA dehydrogenase family protein [Deltaproteobacteria bacterium]|nr:acyl-CoA dehydrogenase family protein [Deltaproteobacteria bacterium]